MHHHSVLTSILEAPFLIEGQGLQQLYAQVAQLLNGQAGSSEAEAKPKPITYAAFTPHAAALGVLPYTSLNEIPANSIAVHTVAGVMFPEDTYWGLGTNTLGRLIRQADAHENIIAHVGVFRTPGGSTMGLEDFASIIAGTKKPFVSYLQQACSAGYWSASGGNVLMLAGRTAMCGSIGTMAEFLDFTGYFEKLGIKQVSANATKSTHKNASFKAAIAGDLKPLQEEILDPLNEVFLSTVTTTREGKLDPKKEKEVLSGKVFIGQTNLDYGLADLMGSLEDAIALAQQLADEAATNGGSAAKNATTSSNSTTTMSLFAKKLTLGAAMLAIVGKETVSAEEATAANTELEAANIIGAKLITEAAFTDLEAKAGRVDTAEAALTTAQKEATDAKAAEKTATDALEAATKRADTAEAEATRLGNLAGAGHTTTRLESGKTDIQDNEDRKTTAELLAALPHNQALDNNPLFN
ncbi:S49 family peptidase [uncultured Hymenobacter sp.]|uniref:S49 family peptidase n=1 Tax=uncultured Hymenobacter sp. TaxID=170016 RepID=UPI0035CAAE64